MSGSSSAAIARSEVQLGVKECDGRDGQPAGEIAAGRGGTAETRGGRNKQPEGETGRRAIGGNCLMPACTAPVQMMSPAPHSSPSTLRSSLPLYHSTQDQEPDIIPYSGPNFNDAKARKGRISH